MQIDQCSLTLGVFIGAIVTTFILVGWYGQRDARARIKKLAAAKKTTGEAIKKAQAERVAGRNALPGAYMILFVGLVMLAMLVVILISGQV